MAADNSILWEIGPKTIKDKLSPLPPWRPRRWLAPLAPLYLLGARLHRRFMLARDKPFRPSIPLVVIGALRAGGSGKTSVTAALARALSARGLRVAVLAYRLNGGGRSGRGGDLLEVNPDGDWKESSDEAVLLSRESGARVFATRHRARAWRALHDIDAPHGAIAEPAAGPARFDVILSDDGFQDPRLHGALRILLERSGDEPGLWDLLPAGPFRETRGARARAHLILRESPGAREGSEAGAGLWFRCRAAPPPGADPRGPWIAVCGLGDNARFVAELRARGFAIAEVLEAADHALPAPERLRRCAERHPDAGFLCTRKEAVKLAPPPAGLAVVDRAVELDPRVLDAVEAHCRRPQFGTLPPCVSEKS